jgi:hypothetical protein
MPATTGENYTGNKAIARRKWLNINVLHPVGASCKHVERPACFYPFLHGFYGFLQCRITKKCRRKGKKDAEITENAAGKYKTLQKPEKWLLKNKKGYRRMSFPIMA